MSNKIAAAVTKLVSALEPLENADERQRAIQAAMTVFGDTVIKTMSNQTSKSIETLDSSDSTPHGIHPAGVAWMKRNNLSMQEIEQLFHIDDEGVNLLSAVGEGKRQQTINTYLLTGVSALLNSGKAEFADELARSNCENLGSYDVNNHGKTLEKFGISITGSKKSGWKLTAPGLTTAAAMLKSSMKKEAK